MTAWIAFTTWLVADSLCFFFDIVSKQGPATPAIVDPVAVPTYHALFGGADAAGAGCTLHGASKSVRAFMTGDLAIYSTILGKEHMSGLWCPYCDLLHSDWQNFGHSAGKTWTLDRLKTHLHRIS